MGLFPCSLCGQRFRGSAQTVYPSLVRANSRLSAHLRLCPVCWDDVHERLTARAIQLSYEPGMDQEVQLCVVCDAPLRKEQSEAVFATVYEKGEERQDFLGGAHHDCGIALEAQWMLVEQR